MHCEELPLDPPIHTSLVRVCTVSPPKASLTTRVARSRFKPPVHDIAPAIIHQRRLVSVSGVLHDRETAIRLTTRNRSRRWIAPVGSGEAVTTAVP
jgi:hypothetical protein